MIVMIVMIVMVGLGPAIHVFSCCSQ